MAQYNPFAEHAGMRRIQETTPHPKILQAIEQLRALGFNPILLASKTHNLKRLREPSPENVDRTREILLDIPSVYYKRLSSRNKPYIQKAEMTERLSDQPREKLAHILHILSVLSETKVYLYWSPD